ncbi:MAG: LysR family transcriptional regulator [Sneathiella sp.]
MASLDQLKMFVATAEAGSFSAAGRLLGKGQSAISLAIANFETDLGFNLFDRSTRKPALTSDGVRMLTFARAVLQQAEDLDIAAQSIFAGEETCSRLVLDDALLPASFSQVLIDFGQKFPATQIEFFSAVSPEIPEIVASGDADIGLMFSSTKVQKGLEQIFIGNLPFIAVSAPDYPLVALESIGASDLLPYRQLLLRSPSGSVLDQFPPLSVDIWYAASFYTMRELVLQGIGWAYLPEHMVSGALRTNHLTKLKLRFEHKHWSPPVECVMRKNAPMGPALSWLSEKVREILP